MRDAYLVGGVRSPNGKFGGAFRHVSVVELGTAIAKEALARSGVPPEDVGEIVMAHCRQAGTGPNPARQVGVFSGLPKSASALTVNMACGSGLKAIQLAHSTVMSGAADAVLVVGAENMSRMPHLVRGLRWEGTSGDIVLEDGWRDAATDPTCGLTMGQTAEELASHYGVSRAEQDEWAARSQHRVREAWSGGRFTPEVAPMKLEHGALDQDETYRSETTLEALSRLRPAFREGGTVTAGNSSSMADGAAALLVVSGDLVRRYSLQPMAKLRSFAAVGVSPGMMGTGPVDAIPLALARCGLQIRDIDLIELNEAFACQVVANIHALGLDSSRVNVNGGAIALGHPTGQSGCRIVVTLLHELARRGGTVGLASLCVGGGQGVAAVFERQ